MDKHSIHGKTKQMAGGAKQKIGDALDDRELQARGAAQRTEGKVQESFGKAREALRDGARKLRH